MIKHMNITLTRANFEKMCEPIFERLKKPVIQALKDAKNPKIDKVILVGGSTRIPKVQKLVEDELNGKKDVHDSNIKAAEDAIAGINGDSDDLKSIHDAYTNIVNVVKSPTIDNLQNMRTSIANMSDSNISRHLNDTIESDMIKHVAEKTNKTVKDVTLASKP
ncbi:MAG: hypothetical protein EOM67_13270, partial [Spirochaetia bacterium]|nr:hypothetical protein [Spirochaetia bacterium]